MTALAAVAVLVVVAYSLLLQGERLSAASAEEPATQMKPAAADSARLAGAYRFQRGGWTYVHLQGSPDQIGYQHGYLLAPEIKDAFAAVKLEDTHKTKHNWNFFRNAAHEMLWPQIDAEYQPELQGIVDGIERARTSSKMDLDDVVALNAFRNCRIITCRGTTSSTK